jgi:hypothetical protein
MQARLLLPTARKVENLTKRVAEVSFVSTVRISLSYLHWRFTYPLVDRGLRK